MITFIYFEAAGDVKKVNYFFKEYEIVMESEKPANHKSKSEEEILREYQVSIEGRLFFLCS